MRKFAIIFIVFVSISCTKTTINISKNDLSGTWILKQHAGGISYHVIIPTDNITITFKPSGAYTSSLNDTITANGNYSITKAGDPNYYYSDILLHLFPAGNSETIYGLNLKNGTLELSEGCCDQFGYTYVRQK